MSVGIIGDPTIAAPAAPRPFSRRIVCSVPGVVAGSPLAQLLRKIVEPAGLLLFDSVAAPAPRFWQRVVAGTGLEWFGVIAMSVEPASSDLPDVVLDLFGTLPPRPGTWRLTVDGAPLLRPFAALTGCHQAPFVSAVRLCGHAGERYAQAQLSSRLPYRALLRRLAGIVGFVVRNGLSAPAGGVEEVAETAPLPATTIRREQYRVSARVLADRWFGRMLSETWAVGEIRCPPADLLQGQMPPVVWIVPSTAHDAFADPFPWPGRPGVILCERFGRPPRRGDIVAIDARMSRAEVLQLGLDCHLSYPFTWTEPDGRHFCVPESSAARQTIIFELDPGGGAQRICVVDEGHAISDPTVFRHGGLYWLAYADSDIGVHDSLCLLYAERLEGPWRPHRLNPVKIDIRSARPGGTPFRVGPALFRPAQDCALSYGSALSINRIDVCTPDAYAETTVATLRPDPNGDYPDGMHTLTVDGDRVLVDGKRRTVSPKILFRKLGTRLRRGH